MFSTDAYDTSKCLIDSELLNFIKDTQEDNYPFLSQIISFTNVELEKNYLFLTALLKKLPYAKTQLPLDVVNDIELDSYIIQHKFTTTLELESGDGELEGMQAGG